MSPGRSSRAIDYWPPRFINGRTTASGPVKSRTPSPKTRSCNKCRSVAAVASPTAARARTRRPPPLGLAGEQRAEAHVILATGRAALEVRAHARNRRVGIAAVELELDVAIELLEALIAAELRACGTGEARDQAISIAAGGSCHSGCATRC